MKAFLRNFIMIALFVLPVYGQSASVPSGSADSIGSRNAEAAGASRLEMPAVEASSSALQLPERQEPGMSLPVFRTIGGLGLVLCLIVAAYFAAKKLAPRYFSKGISDRNLKIIETVSMGDKRSISMIEVGNSRFLIGNTPNQINLLAALPDAYSMVSEPEKLEATSKDIAGNNPALPFRNLFETEKRRSTQYEGNPIPDDIRMKMRKLRASLER